MKAFIRYDSGPKSIGPVKIDKAKVTFGRHLSCDCVLNHPTVSREHFRIERVGAKLLAVDLSSGNGTYANGERVSWVELKDGDKIQAGPFAFTVEISSEQKDSPMADDPIDYRASRGGGQISHDERYEAVYPREYIEGIEHFNARRYFEAHEVWEEVWLRSTGDTKLFYQMLIQAAVGLHHYERGNARGGRGMFKAVTDKLQRLPAVFMSLSLADFSKQYRSFFSELIEADNEAPPDESRPRPFIRLLAGD